MRAVLIQRRETGTGLAVGEAPTPVLEAGQVRIAVRAVSLNHADLLAREGGYGPVPDSATPWVAGLDAAGDVVEVGAGVSGLVVGDRVMTMASGGLAEEVVVDARRPLVIPSTWSYVEGAAAVVGLLTEHDALVTAGRFRAGRSVLITGGTAGVAMQGVQLAHHLGASTVVVTARSARADAVLHRLGAELVVHTGADGFADPAREATAGAGFDVAVDHVGGAHLPELVRAAAIAGRIVNVGRVAGAESTLDLEALSLKRLHVVGVTFRTRDADEIAAVSDRVRALDLETAAEALRPVVDRVLPWEQTEQAQELLTAGGQVVGKLVLEIPR